MRNAHWHCVAPETKNNMSAGLSIYTFSSPSPRQWKTVANGLQPCFPLISRQRKNHHFTNLWLATVGSHHCSIFCLLPQKRNKMVVEPPAWHLFLPPKVMPSSSRVHYFYPTAMIRVIQNNLDTFTQSKLCTLTTAVKNCVLGQK